MTVANNYKPIKQVGNGNTTSFSFDFPVITESEVEVYQNIDGVESLVDNNSYTITLNSNGGVVNFKTAPAQGITIAIVRNVDLTQETPFLTSSGFPADRVEDCFDKLTMITQQQQQVLDRCVKVVVTDNQTPEELLEEVYNKLDSATDVANDAIAAAEQATVAAENATTAVEVAQKQIEQTQQYVTEAKVEINNTKESATSTISTTTENAKSDITKTVTDAKSDINAAIDEATTNISNIVSNAEGEVANIAITEANKAISNAAQEATDLVNAYVDSEIKPQLDEATASASGSATSASSSATAAQNSANQASSSATSASSSATSAANSATAAAKSAASIDTSNLVDRSSSQTIGGVKTFTDNINRVHAFSGASNHTIQDADSNRKGSIAITPYYTSNRVYHRMATTNLTSEKTAYLDVTVTDNGNAGLQFGGNASVLDANFQNTTSFRVPTPATTDNSTQAATTAFVNNKFQVVTALPSSPTAGVFYFVKE